MKSKYEEEESEDMIGPPLDSRATNHEQWIVSVRLIEKAGGSTCA